MPNKRAGYRAGIPQEPYTKWDADKDEIEVDYKQMEDSRNPSWFSGRKGTVLKILIVIVTFFIGLICGYLAKKTVQKIMRTNCFYSNGDGGYHIDISKRLSSYIEASNMELNLRNYTESVHLTGTHQNNLLRDKLQSQLLQYNLSVKLTPYKVILSYPDWENRNTIYLLNENGTIVYRTDYSGPPEPYHPDLTEPYNAFSPAGVVEGELVYANYGETIDFNDLEAAGVSVKDKIVIMRYGIIFRALKVRNAAARGAKGVILYSDPEEVLGSKMDPSQAYPNSWWLPGWAAQSGTILPGLEGDPTTPGLPSIDGVVTLDTTEAGLPTIPSQPIGYEAAEKLLEFMGGPEGETTVRGGLQGNVTYRLGPGYTNQRANWTVRLEVNNEVERREITNVIGVLEGREEPDRYVILGSHYDAWSFGGTDPNTGTTVVQEIAKAFSRLKQEGWTPRRTLMFVHWDAEEQGLMGSTEYVEEYYKELEERTVAVINLDGAIRGNYTLDVQSSPLMRSLIYNVTKMFPAVGGSGTVFDVWSRHDVDPDDTSKPFIRDVGQSSDHAPFLFMLGIPVMWPRYYFDRRSTNGVSHPAYHTAIDNFDYVKRFTDPTFKAHQNIAQIVGEIALQLASSLKIPFDVRELGTVLGEGYNKVKTTFGHQLAVPLDHLEWAIRNFTETAELFHSSFQAVEVDNILRIRRYNDAVMRVPQAFIYPPGLPKDPMHRNILFSPSQTNPYDGSTFSAITDALAETLQNSNNNKSPKTVDKWYEVKKQISIATLSVKAATRILSLESL